MSSCANIWQVQQEITGSLKAFIKNNRANKRPLLPGSSLLSLVHAVAAEHGDSSVTSRYTTAALITAFTLLLFTRIPAEATGLRMCSHVTWEFSAAAPNITEPLPDLQGGRLRFSFSWFAEQVRSWHLETVSTLFL